ncbi:cytochrome P450 [Spirillospora sp. NPDC048911]|uniref:cytochrome P450 n=1 Tax=Spirillospora sp. NPDC048911 TaxID=3364527 RepID=UPI00372095C4
MSDQGVPWDAVEALWTEEGLRDPFPHLQTMLEHAPVLPAGPRRVLVLGFDECDQVLRDSETFRVCGREWAEQAWPSWRSHRSVKSVFNQLNRQDAPDNQPARKLLVKMFGRQRLEGLRADLDSMADEYVDRFRAAASAGEVDAVEYLLGLPLALLAKMMGFPQSDLPLLKRMAKLVMAANDFNPPGTGLDEVDEAFGELQAYLSAFVDDGEPGAVNELATRWPEDDRQGLLDTISFLLGAGNETSSSMLGTGIAMLSRRPELVSLLGRQPEMVGPFTQEVLRFDPPAKMAARWSTKPVHLGPVRLPGHCMLVVLIGAASRDKRHYSAPERFDPYRFADVDAGGGEHEPEKSLPFGSGPHYCIGAGLARLTGDVVFGRLAERCAGLMPTEPAVRTPGLVVHGYERLPVTIRKPSPRGRPQDSPQDRPAQAQAAQAQVNGDTLPEALERLASNDPATGWMFPAKGLHLAASALYRSAHRAARGLHAEGVRHGDRVGVLMPTGPGLWQAFFAVNLAGAAVSMLPVRAFAEPPSVAAERLARIVDAAGMRHVVADPRYDALVRALIELKPQLRCLPLPDQGAGPLPELTPGDLAVVQFTSGSTAFPKGVTLSHSTVLAGLRGLLRSADITRQDSLAQWVPHHHDMGLFTPLAYGLAGLPVHMFPPAYFMRKPLAFLEYFSRQGVTTMTSPNFGYAHLSEAVRATPPSELRLHQWRLAYNGAEPVQAGTVQEFTSVMGKYGASPEVMYPVYGLAEATLAASVPLPGAPARVVHVDRARLLRDGVAAPVSASPQARALVSVGRPVDGMQLRLVDTDANAVAAGEIGEVQLAGPAVTAGYLNAPTATAETFDGAWFRTGDLGVRLDGDLFIVGRSKDTIIMSGSNIHPEDAESIVAEVPGVHRGRCVAFGAGLETGEPEQLMIAVEMRNREHATELAEEIHHRIRDRLGAFPMQVRIVRPGAIPVTTSGKVRRDETRRLLTESKDAAPERTQR